MLDPWVRIFEKIAFIYISLYAKLLINMYIQNVLPPDFILFVIIGNLIKIKAWEIG